MSKSTSAHTAGRLTALKCGSSRGGCYYLESEDGREIAQVWDHPEAEANAARLALAYNSHEELLKALEEWALNGPPCISHKVVSAPVVGCDCWVCERTNRSLTLLAKLTA